MRVVLMYSLSVPSQQHIERLQALSPKLRISVVENEAQALAVAEDAEVILGHRYLRQCLPKAKSLRWVQSSAGNVDRLPVVELAERGVILTRWTQDARVVAAHAVALAWALARALPEVFRYQSETRWDQHLHFAPLPGKALVLGQGAVGRAIAARLRAEGITIICGKRNPADQVPASPCRKVLAKQQWRDELSDCDWCFLALPHTEETYQLFDESALRALPAHAVLVNVGRGETLDTGALLRVLNEGHLAGVGLDVVQPEPLPPGHPLWRAPRVLVTPHIASHHPGRIDRIERFFEEQLQAFLAARPLSEVVDLETAGYGDSQAEDPA